MRISKVLISCIIFTLFLNLYIVVSQSNNVSVNLQKIKVENASNLEVITQIDIQFELADEERKTLTDIVVCGSTEFVVELNDFYDNPANDSLEVWDWNSNNKKYILQDYGRAFSTRCSPNNRYVISTNRSTSLTHLWDISSSELVRTWEIGFPTAPPEFSPDSRILAFTSEQENRLTLWDVDQDNEINIFQAIPFVSALAFNSNTDFLVVGDEEGTAYTINMDKPSDTTILFRDAESLGIVDIAFSPNSELIAFAGWSPPQLYIWSLTENQLIARERGGIINQFYFSPRQSRIAAFDRDGTSQLFVLETGQELPTQIDRVPSAINELNTLVVIGEQTLVLVDIESGRQLFDFQTIDEIDLSYEYFVSFAPNDNYIIFADADGMITILGIR